MTTTQQPVRFTCTCGSKSTEVVGHYDIVRCNCGKFQWTLQPQRGGPLRFFPWPGPNLTRAELEAREAETETGNTFTRIPLISANSRNSRQPSDR